jgi:hypothetical protein
VTTNRHEAPEPPETLPDRFSRRDRTAHAVARGVIHFFVVLMMLAIGGAVLTLAASAITKQPRQ